MKWKQPIQHSPDGAPVIGFSAVLRRIADGTTVATYQSDQDGYITVQRDGHLEPVYLHLQDAPGGDKLSRSDETHTAGATCPAEWPAALRALGDGVVRDYAGKLDCTLGPTSFSVAPGAAVVSGHPVVIYTGIANQALGRPPTGNYLYRVIIRLYPTGSATTPGKADLVLLGPTTGTAPPLTQTTTVWEMALATITVPQAGDPTCLDERTWAGSRPDPVRGEVRAAGAVTTNATGEALAGMATVNLALPQATTYDVVATLSAVQYGVTPQWVLQGTYGPSFNGLTASGMGQIADVTKVYVTDDGQNRVFTLDLATGAYIQAISILNPFGVALDIARSVYISYVDGANGWRLRKYDAAHTLQWTGAIQQDPIAQLTVFGSLWATNYNTNKVSRYNTSTGAFIDSFGSSGTGNGQFNVPWGICYNPIDGYLYVVDSGNNRMQVFTTAGAYVRQFSIGAGSKGVANDAAGNLWIANQTYNVLEKQSPIGVVLQDITQTAPMSLTLTSTDVIWVVSADGTVSKWDETPSGYGEIAINLNGTVSSYVGSGNRVAGVANVATGAVTGPGTVTITPYGRATTGQMSLQGLLLTATATPRGVS